ncbi:MAG: hypothetical protein KDA36_05960, partial [Planctomycetaceae bacterium]|nr:hypothetical protein [Planctomycetaceae bacterium]
MSRFRLTARAIPTIGLLILLEPFGGEPLQAQQDRLDKTPLKPYQMRVPEMTRAEASVGVDFRAFGRYGYGQYQPISPCGFVGIKCVPSRAKVMAYPGPTPVTIPPWFDLVSPTPGNSQYAQDAAPFHHDVISQFKSTRPEDEAAIALASSRGDEYVLQGEFTRALDQYRQASRLGEDQVDLRFKMMILLAEAGLYREAACELRSGLSLDPNWLDKGVSLSEFFGPGKEELIRRVIDSTASW